jgi:outer membrane protein OmpA-like peptidoglycan-associated protein
MNRSLIGTMVLGLVFGLSVPVSGQEASEGLQAVIDQGRLVKIPAGRKRKIKGVIVRRDVDNFIMGDIINGYILVNLTNMTRVKEKKTNPFGIPKNYGPTQLFRGLTVEVEGVGDTSGALLAKKVRMTEDALIVARTFESRAVPVEGRVTDAETRLSHAEVNVQRLSGQLEELQSISNAMDGGAEFAQETADVAGAAAEATNRRIDWLVTSLDNYEPKQVTIVNFRVRSTILSEEAKLALAELASRAKAEHAYVIEVSGYASSEGSENLNRQLSQQRADAVVRYLAEFHMIPLRCIITPFGYGESQPVAENTTREGREQNRRVEVKILVNKGLVAPPAPVRILKPNATSE